MWLYVLQWPGMNTGAAESSCEQNSHTCMFCIKFEDSICFSFLRKKSLKWQIWIWEGFRLISKRHHCVIRSKSVISPFTYVFLFRIEMHNSIHMISTWYLRNQATNPATVWRKQLSVFIELPKGHLYAYNKESASWTCWNTSLIKAP